MDNMRIKILRHALGLSLIDFGSRLGFSNQTVGAWERNEQKISDDALAKICAVFHVHEEWLKTGAGEMFSVPPAQDADVGTLEGRIRKVRENARMTQRELSHRMGISLTVMCEYESGERAPTSQAIKFLCLLFSVREKWLRTGRGKMYEADRDSALWALLAMFPRTGRRTKLFIRYLLSLPPEKQDAMMEFVKIPRQGEDDDDDRRTD